MNQSMAVKFKRMAAMLFLMAVPAVAEAWGFWGHKRINFYAIRALPAEMGGFFLRNSEWLTQNAAAADRRRYCRADEKQKHYIDLDLYGAYPFKELPRSWSFATARYSENTIRANGTLPWVAQWEYSALVEAFRKEDSAIILYRAANLAHYLADACVPFHTTCNYNGQYTGQTGIHSLWESRLPEYNAHLLFLMPTRPARATILSERIWEVLLESYRLVAPALRDEHECATMWGEDKHCRQRKRTRLKTFYSEGFMQSYSEKQLNAVYDRLTCAIDFVAGAWYSAWLEAGQPNLDFVKKMEPERGIAEEMNDLFKGEIECVH